MVWVILIVVVYLWSQFWDAVRDTYMARYLADPYLSPGWKLRHKAKWMAFMPPMLLLSILVVRFTETELQLWALLLWPILVLFGWITWSIGLRWAQAPWDSYLIKLAKRLHILR